MTSHFCDLQTIDSLAGAFGTDPSLLVEYAEATPQADFYQVIHIPKRGKRRRGQFRTVYKAKVDWLRQLHRQIAKLVVFHSDFQDCVQGFVHKRSIVTNARLHLGAAILLHGDIANFFDRISVERVATAFEILGSPPKMAQLLARTTTIDGALRQGTRCAPVLANLVCRRLDIDMMALAKAHGARYTRYADDLTFSGASVPASDQVQVVIRHEGFELRDGRCYQQHRGRSQYVTGLTISHLDKPRLPRRMKRNLRLVLHHIERIGADGHFERMYGHPTYKHKMALDGALKFFYSVEPDLLTRFRAQFPKAMAELGW